MLLATLTAGAVAGGLYALDRLASSIVRAVPGEPDVRVPQLGLRHEDLVVPSGDHALRGWLLCPVDPGDRPLVLLVHGWGANYGSLLRLAEPLVALGYPVLLFDVRGHGRNEPVPHVTVRHFRDDILSVARYAAERFGRRKLVLVGHSLGGAGSVLAAERGAPVDGLVLIAAPADVLEVTADYLRDKGLPGGLMVLALRPFWWLRVGGTFRHLVPERKIGALRQPVLLLQPERDRRVARAHAERLAAASGAPMSVIPGAGHTDVLGHHETHGRIVAFLEEVAARPGGRTPLPRAPLPGAPLPGADPREACGTALR